MVKFEDVEVGSKIPDLVKPAIERIQLVKYAGASGDFNPIHVDEPYAKSAGYPSVFAHGMLSMGFVAQLITDWAGVGSIREFGVRFRAITWPGDTITCKGVVKSKGGSVCKRSVELEVWAENQKGEKTISGTATVELPSRSRAKNYCGKERRKHPRIPISARIKAIDDGEPEYLMTNDVSIGGAGLMSDTPPQIGEKLSLEISIAGVKGLIKTKSVVVRHFEGGFGVRFTRFETGGKAKLDRAFDKLVKA